MATPLIMGEAEEEALMALDAYAAEHPVQMRTLLERLNSAEGKESHMEQMRRQSVMLPLGFLVTYSIEEGHPIGRPCRHMSMSSPVRGRLPSPEAIDMVAKFLGFTGSCRDDPAKIPGQLWIEDTHRDGEPHKAINWVQPVTRKCS